MSDIRGFFSKIGADMKKGFDSLIKSKPKIWREWTPELAQSFQAFYNGPVSTKASLARFQDISTALGERCFHYNSPHDERQGKIVLRRVLHRLVDLIRDFVKVHARNRLLVQETTLRALVRREFDLDCMQFRSGKYEPQCSEVVMSGIAEYRKILTEIFQVVAAQLNCADLEHSHRQFLVRLLAVCFLRMPNLQQKFVPFLSKHVIMQKTRLLEEKKAEAQDGGHSHNGSVPDIYSVCDSVFSKQRRSFLARTERQFEQRNPTIFKWDFFVNAFDEEIVDTAIKTHQHFISRVFCNGLWVSTFFDEYVQQIRLAIETTATKPSHVAWHILPWYPLLVRHFCTVVQSFVIGLRKHEINLWDTPAPETDYEGTEMRIDNGQTTLRTMLQTVQTSLHNPSLLRIFVHAVLINTSVHDYPNMGRSLDWVASWSRTVALLSPGGLIPGGCLDIDTLIQAARVLLRNEYAIGVSHALSFINSVVKFLNTRDRAALWSGTVLDPTPLVEQAWAHDGSQKPVSNFARLLCNWNMQIRKMFAKTVVYHSFTINRRFLPVVSDRSLVEVPPPPPESMKVCPACLLLSCARQRTNT